MSHQRGIVSHNVPLGDSTLARRVDRIVLRLTRVSGLDHKVPAVPVEVGAVQHVVDSRLQVVPVGHQPVLVVADEE